MASRPTRHLESAKITNGPEPDWICNSIVSWHLVKTHFVFLTDVGEIKIVLTAFGLDPQQDSEGNLRFCGYTVPAEGSGYISERITGVYNPHTHQGEMFFFEMSNIIEAFLDI